MPKKPPFLGSKKGLFSKKVHIFPFFFSAYRGPQILRHTFLRCPRSKSRKVPVLRISPGIVTFYVWEALRTMKNRWKNTKKGPFSRKPRKCQKGPFLGSVLPKWRKSRKKWRFLKKACLRASTKTPLLEKCTFLTSSQVSRLPGNFFRAAEARTARGHCDATGAKQWSIGGAGRAPFGHPILWCLCDVYDVIRVYSLIFNTYSSLKFALEKYLLFEAYLLEIGVFMIFL